MPKPSAAQLALFEGKSWWPPELLERAGQAPPPPPPPPPPPDVEVAEAARDWRPSAEDPVPAVDDDDEKLPSPEVFAVRLLRTLAESPLVLSSVRVKARKYLKKLAKAGETPDMPDDEEDDDPEGDEAFRPAPA
jgi:hypothetical protein